MILDKILNKVIKTNEKQKTGGKIEYYGLSDWWLKNLIEEERNIIRVTYNPMSSSIGYESSEIIDKGNINFCSQSKLGFIGSLVGWFQKNEHYEIAKKIIKLGEDNINDRSDILDKHFFYLNCIKVHYKNRDTNSDALDKSIEYCKKQISISNESKMEFENDEYFEILPSHTGYKQLAIIYEKQKEYQKALDLTKQALKEGWNDECLKRIDRLERKLKKIKE